ncbi:hypothetical protein BC830DRAFT_1172222 [Chytriomyces sp. MP71]|nr:hypothetical protein BC830DRAFT_1172222 [Chytriomyces sp. MP71]
MSSVVAISNATSPAVSQLPPSSETRLLVVSREYSVMPDSSRDPETPYFVPVPEALPPPLLARVSVESLCTTLSSINALLAKVAVVSYSSAFNSFAAFFCLGFSADTEYADMLRALDDLIETENRTVYEPKGLRLRNPRYVSFLRVEFEVID